MKKQPFTKKYYQKVFQKAKTLYDFTDSERAWLGDVKKDGSVKQAINIELAAAINNISKKEYLFDMYKKGMLCGNALDYSLKKR